ncbi:carbohydrate-binding protein [Streptomyces klenkii]|uniref:Carbohydrate-binding protein n=1 Tax=Streptomyces klenkii TaxID=1420899 RepID=A0A3B0BGP4_9ACTN|nr:carbohydrate-binding protein [Streptomyces klenkii]RKN71538.1 carbohydrate-binding protein [Streptomyces klenkii]
MKRARTALLSATAALAALAALGAAVPAASHPRAAGSTASAHRDPVPSPGAPHRGTVAGARTPGHSPARDRAARIFAEGRRAAARAGSLSRHDRTPGGGTATPEADLTHNWWGVFPQPGTHDGIQATHSVDASYRVSDSENFTYSPTTKAQNSCMEVVTAYWNSGNEIWAWDWCSSPGGPAKTLAVDAAFLATYTDKASGRPAYSVQMVQDDAAANRWSAYLYNYRTAGWDLLFRQSGKDQSGLSHGWDMFEIYASVNPSTGTGYYCTEARTTVFDSGAVALRSRGTWRPARPADSPWTEESPQGRDFLCPPLKFLQAGANDHWTVRQ